MFSSKFATVIFVYYHIYYTKITK